MGRHKTRHGKKKGVRFKDFPKCPAGCGKYAYPTEHQASQAAVTQRGGRVYWCERGSCWHLTSKKHRRLTT